MVANLINDRGNAVKNQFVITGEENGKKVITFQSYDSRICDNGSYKGEHIINFEIEPYNDEAEQILGNFYSHGCYGGVESLTLEKLN